MWHIVLGVLAMGLEVGLVFVVPTVLLSAVTRRQKPAGGQERSPTCEVIWLAEG